jgi:hypothetical protein
MRPDERRNASSTFLDSMAHVKTAINRIISVEALLSSQTHASEHACILVLAPRGTVPLSDLGSLKRLYKSS